MHSRLPGRGYHYQTDKVGIWIVPTHHCFSLWSRKEFETQLFFFNLCLFKMLYILSLKYAITPQGTSRFITGISYGKCMVTKYPEWTCVYQLIPSKLIKCIAIIIFNRYILLSNDQKIKSFPRQLVQNKRVCNMCKPDLHDWTRTAQTASRKDSQGNWVYRMESVRRSTGSERKLLWPETRHSLFHSFFVRKTMPLWSWRPILYNSRFSFIQWHKIIIYIHIHMWFVLLNCLFFFSWPWALRNGSSYQIMCLHYWNIIIPHTVIHYMSTIYRRHREVFSNIVCL